MCQIMEKVHWVRAYSGVHTVVTEVNGLSTQIDWPCVYVGIDNDNSKLDLSLSQDDFVGLVVNDTSSELFMPEYIVCEDTAIEICGLWGVLQSSHGISNCCVKVICSRKSTWCCLKKKKHKSNMITIILRLYSGFPCIITLNLNSCMNVWPNFRLSTNKLTVYSPICLC